MGQITTIELAITINNSANSANELSKALTGYLWYIYNVGTRRFESLICNYELFNSLINTYYVLLIMSICNKILLKFRSCYR